MRDQRAAWELLTIQPRTAREQRVDVGRGDAGCGAEAHQPPVDLTDLPRAARDVHPRRREVKYPGEAPAYSGLLAPYRRSEAQLAEHVRLGLVPPALATNLNA
jgi:hypothetical protein